MENPLKTGLLAYGMSGKVFHAPFLEAHPGFHFYAVTERNEKKAFHNHPDVISYNSVPELLADENLELVIINTPNYTHYEYSKLALEAGKNILVEKPFATSYEEGKELFGLARKNGLKLMVYQNRRWDSDFLSVKEIIESGRLGKIIEMHIRFDRYRNTIGVKRFKEDPVPGSGISWDLGPHLIDQAINLFGEPQTVTKTLGRFREGTAVDDFATFHLQFKEDLNVFVTASMLVANPQAAYVVHGTDGSYIKERADVQEAQLVGGRSPLDSEYGLEPSGSEGTLTLVDPNGEKVLSKVPSKKGNYVQIFDEVYEHLRNNKPFPISEDEVLWQLRCLETEENRPQ